jgi:hypothetical protein
VNLYFADNFDADTVGALPSWFTAIAGSWSVQALSYAYSAPNALQSTTAADGDLVVITGGSGVDVPVVADLIMAYSAGYFCPNLTPLIRCSANGQNWYGWAISGGPGSNIYATPYKCVSGSISPLGGSQTISGITGGESSALNWKIAAIGTTISLKVWNSGTTEPVSYQANVTDSSITAAGYGAFRISATGGVVNSVDNLEMFGADSTLTPGAITTSGIASTTATLTAASPNGGTAPYSYQWYLSTESGFVPQTSNVASGATGLVYNAAGLLPATTYNALQIVTDSSGAIAWSNYAVFTTTTSSATDFSLTPSSQTTLPGTATGDYTVTLNGTLASNETVALSDGGAGGTFTPSSLNFTSANAGTPQEFTYAPASGTAGDSITITVMASGPFSASHTATCSVGSPVTAGVLYATYVGVRTVQLSATLPSGGSESFDFQLYRSTSSGVLGSAVTGATGPGWVDNPLTGGTHYYYTVAYTDTVSETTAYSAQVAVQTLPTTALEIVGGLGDSIEAGSYSTIETPFAAMIDQLNFGMPSREWYGGTVTTGTSGALNLSLNYSVSGTTSANWLPTGSAGLTTAATAWAAAGVTRIVSELGGNDAKGSVATAPSTYQSNMATIIAYLFENIPTLKSVHLFGPMSQNEPSGDESVANCGRLIEYDACMEALANGSTVFHANALQPYNYFQRRSAMLQRSADSVHPNDYGDQTTGGIWAHQVIAALSPTTAGYSRARIVNA